MKNFAKFINNAKLYYSIFFLFLWQSIIAQTFTIYSGEALKEDSLQVQAGDIVNRKDANNIKQGLWFYKDKKTGKIKSIGNYANGKRTGLWIKFRPDGSKLSEFHYIKAKKIGLAKTYYTGGKLQEEGYWKVDTWLGNYYYYYPNGKLCYEWFYDKAGNRTGEQKYFHENGKLKIEGNWVKGKRNGMLKEYYEDGSLKSEKKFVDGEMDTLHVKNYKPAEKHAETTVSTVTTTTEKINKNEHKINPPHDHMNTGVFNPNGYNKLYNIKNKKLEKDGLFKNGRLYTGKHFIYNEEGKVIRILIYKDGKRIKDVKL